jgi:RND superfamily putative drug exporter
MNQASITPRSRRLTLLAWLIVALAALPLALRVNEKLDATTRLEGSESARVEAALRENFRSPFTKIALLRIAQAPDPRTDDGQAVLKQIAAGIRGTPGVQGVMSYLDRQDSLFLGKDDSPILIVGLSVQKSADEGVMAALRVTTDTLRAQLRQRYPDISFGWTGEAVVNADMRHLSGSETRTAELRVLPLTLVLLIIAFRSLVCAALPIVCGALTIVVSLATVAAVSRWWPASIIVISIISMVGLGLSIDYAWLIVIRSRDGLGQGLPRAEAVALAARRGGRTVIVSGLTVAIGFAAMLQVRVSEIRSIGMGGLIVTAVAVLVACTLLPAVLSAMGSWIDAGSWGLARKPDTGRLWRRWGAWITRHPLIVVIVAGIPVGLLAAQGAHLRIDLPRGHWLPESAESVRVLRDIESVARGNFAQIDHVILYFPDGTTIHDESGWRAESRLVRFFARDPRVQHVWAASSLGIVPLAGPEILQRIPESVRRSFVSDDGRAVLVEVLPKPGLAETDAEGLVRDIRAVNPQAVTGLEGARLDVGGVPAFNVDYEQAIKDAMGTLVASVICATLLVLSIAFRSVLIPIKAVILNLLSVAAAFGAVVLVFQQGILHRLVGLTRPLDGGFPILPVLVFCIVFGLSMDYEVFMVARIADGRRAGLSDDEALVESLVGTGRVITFAASIMVLIFGGFVFGSFVLIKTLGFALGVAVFLDATVIRLALGPALVRLAGRWNWWPGRKSLERPLQ